MVTDLPSDFSRNPSRTPPTDDEIQQAVRLDLTVQQEGDVQTMLVELKEFIRQRDDDLRNAVSEMYLGLTLLLEQGTDRKPPAPGATEPMDLAGRHGQYRHYQQLIQRIKEVVRGVVPPDSTVIVVSKGDDELLKLPGCIGWHFPRELGGGYAGHYPADSNSAIAHVEDLRSQGAQFLLFPATALWWLDHYKELKQHLEARYRVVVRQEDTCLIFALQGEGGRSHDINLDQRPVDQQRSQNLIRQLREIVASILPKGATVLVVSQGDEELLKLDGMIARHFPTPSVAVPRGSQAAESAAVIAHLDALRAEGAQYLLIPASSFWWLARSMEIQRYVESRCRIVVHQRHVCFIFDLMAG
jgi:hypothetical protein